MPELAALGWLFVVVSFGAIVPIVPTGAAVSGAAALAFHDNPFLIVLVIAAGAAGAYAGDLVMYAMCRAGGEQLARRLRWLRDEEHLGAVKERLQRTQIPVLLVSRLLPGGRVPVLLAAAFLGLSWRTFVVANLPACTLWSVVYAGIGVAGGSIFPEPWQGVVAAIILVVVIGQVVSLVNKRRAERAEPGEASPSTPGTGASPETSS
ncbi:membrane protein [Actinoplanes sp. NBRC 14428]|uniref:Membrane protein DedA with SNARE-associated domain n=1 Tax=Pseudosporangium ferrugineum TaxID=439699 RepID=A0A2T0RQ85_9ACTN|nr:VTT domain-containing protein [Pseudosporangium ferrugineum]PRY23356.1 membrane protein DedA with SNARE-associated domain [Pseudosporangium ferrugineum]BCJ55344.1 membrane protein [Actinoplanes sp. NBRC 14428]